jgi:hypothetical protein
MTYLFAKGRLSDALDQQGKRLDAAVLTMPPERVRHPDAELEQELLSEFRVERVTIRRDDIATQTQEEDVDVSQDWNRIISDRSRPFMMRGTRVTFFVPFDGDASVLDLTPSSFTTVFPEGRVNGTEILIDYTGVGVDAQRVKGQFEGNLNQIERYLVWATKDVETFNEGLLSRIQSGVAARRAKVEHDQTLAEGLGYRKRADAPAQTRAGIVRSEAARNVPVPPPPGEPARGPAVWDLVRKGESRRLEFKSSLRWDRRLSKVNKSLQDEVLQTLAGFLNSGGGDLLIGIADDGSATGIEADLASFKRGGEDAFMRTVGSLVADRIGAEFSPFIDLEIEGFDGKRVCRVHVEGASKPAYVDGSTLFIRTGNATRQLDPRATVDYVQTHWGR